MIPSHICAFDKYILHDEAAATSSINYSPSQPEVNEVQIKRFVRPLLNLRGFHSATFYTFVPLQYRFLGVILCQAKQEERLIG